MTSENEAMNEQQSTGKEQRSPDNQEQRKFRFGNYDLIRRIDIGGMGEVYLASQRTAFGREVAIKIIRSDLVHDTTARQRFLREAEVNAHIKHEHILPLFEFGEEQGRLFLVTPYIAGGTLARRLQAGPLSLSEVYQLFTALVKAIAYIHRRGVVHRDLKPNNILLDQEGNKGQIYVRLIDFGIASIQGQAASPPLTTAGTEMGTLAYMAPERLSGIAAPSNDIYSLGVILYQMLTGQLPSAEHRVALPQQLEYVVDHCIAPISVGRFSSAEEVLDAFEYAYEYLTADLQNQAAIPSQPSIPVSSKRNTAPRVNISRPAGNGKQDIKSLHHSDSIFNTANPASVPNVSTMPPSRSLQPDSFAREDYESPTTNINVSQVQNTQSRQEAAFAPPSPPGKPPRSSRPHHSPLFALLTLLIVIILLVMAGLSFFAFQSVTLATASINFSSQVHAINKVFLIKGSGSQSAVDVSSMTIPVKPVNINKTGSQSGPTSQQCIFPGFGCQQIVTPDDVGKIASQLKQSLDNQISAQIQQQMQTLGAIEVGSVQFSNTSLNEDPTIGTESKTVTVTMAEQGQAAYFLKHDAQSLARLLLNQEVQRLGANYVLLSALTQIGQPVVAGVDSNGVVSIKIAASGNAEYQFPSAQLRSIQNSLKNMKLKDATAFIKQQPGVDAHTVAIHLSTGDTMPGDTQQIKLIPIPPTSIPPVQLPSVSSNSTPTNNATSTALPATVTSTPTTVASPAVTSTVQNQ
ncbi:MAG: hypothetical protein NVS4B7_09810 [Ktedonobacteraceae bacterium]